MDVLPRFVADESALVELWVVLKLLLCPHCRRVGHLVRHGPRKRFRDGGRDKVICGWRVLCSRRGCHEGCGVTMSVLYSDVLERVSVSASVVWALLESMRGGAKFYVAWDAVAEGLSLRTGYRLWARLESVQSTIRTWLSSRKPPGHSDAKKPVLALADHLKKVFVGSGCCVTAYQLEFQTGFLIG
jgi:hypothetical protein